MKKRTQKVVCYVVHRGHLLVFTHRDVPVLVAGVQVPAGSIEPGETPADAAVRETLEETGLRASVERALGVEEYDISPMRFEIATRHFFLLRVDAADIAARWESGETDSSAGGPRRVWDCWWLPMEDAHVLAAGFGARIGSLYADSPMD